MPERPNTLRFTVEPGETELRLDQLLAARNPDLSRRKARVLIDIGGVFVDKQRVKVASRTLRAGQHVEAVLGQALERATKKVGQEARRDDEKNLPRYHVVFADRDIVVVDKPAGLLTAPTPESDRNNLAVLLARRYHVERVHVVHRLDLMTSGLLVFARTARANRVLGERFRVHDLTREYLAVLHGRLAKETVTVDAPVGGKSARTHFTIETRLGDRATVVRARLETGRTHQIRLHVRTLGLHVLGDPQYGRRTRQDPPRMALHATRLGFPHPRSDEPMQFESPWPEDLATWLDGLRANSV
ncbi:MAG: RluA family pseudouridine synthase [Pseudomonadota bacterium]